MARVNALLVLILLVCALGVVSSQHQARRLFVQLEREQERMRNLEVEWGQLQLEASTWASHARIEKIAKSRMHMQAPLPGQVIALELPAPAAPKSSGSVQ